MSNFSNSTDAQIADTLLAWYDGLSTSPAYEKAFPGKVFAPVVGTPYLEATLMPRDVFSYALNGGSEDFGGIFQVSVYWPRNQGIISALVVAGAVRERFKRGTVIRRDGNDVAVRIVRPPKAGPVLEEPDWLNIPVSIPYRVFTTNGG